ncbi:oxygenase MpaB family protein [Nocardioides stalactiti]|uniref:oxygenase MpaB family protein n=1 Tax=Nocardioides stalactiti TaxID=2755356 RepID=UPI001603C537|nr:oxygenase MpaB family protein [Nocardioides stalactiti]
MTQAQEMTRVYVPRPGEALGADSLTWRLFGDQRMALAGMRAGLLQTMHPAVDQALRDHDSTYFQGPMKRILRSLPQILGVVYDADAPATAARVRDYHVHLKGTLADGTRYSALTPEVFYWTHATFFELQITWREFFGKPLSLASKELLFQESRQWYSLYGVSATGTPATYAEFTQYWDEMIAEVLVPNAIARSTFNRTKKGIFGPSPIPQIPDLLWRPLSDAQFDAMAWVLRGTLPPVLRDRMDLEWSSFDDLRLRAMGSGIQQSFGRLPLPARLIPQARQAWRRETGGTGIAATVAS